MRTMQLQSPRIPHSSYLVLQVSGELRSPTATATATTMTCPLRPLLFFFLPFSSPPGLRLLRLDEGEDEGKAAAPPLSQVFI